MDTNIIDQKLKEKAKNEVEQNIATGKNAFNSITETSLVNLWVVIPQNDIIDKGCRASTLLNLVAEAIKNDILPIYEEREIKSFIKDVERLKEDVEELYNEVNS